MKLLRSLLIFGLFLSAIAWLLVTNQGARFVAATTKILSPAEISYTSLEGTLISENIVLSNVTATIGESSASASSVTLNWRNQKIDAESIHGWANFIPEHRILSRDLDSKLKHATVKLNLFKKHEELTVTADGTWYNKPLHIELDAKHQDHTWTLQNLDLRLYNNIVSLNNEHEEYNWRISLPEPELFLNSAYGKLYTEGSFINQKNPSIKTMIRAEDFGFEGLKVTNLRGTVELSDSPIANILADEIKIDDELYTDVKFNIDKDHIFRFLFDEQMIDGTMDYKLFDNNVNICSNSEWYNIELDINLDTFAIQGEATANTEDLSIIMKWIPELTRLKGKFYAHATISGTIQDPVVHGDAHLTKITATFPSLGIKVKPMEIHANTTNGRKFDISGNGVMRRGSGEFKITGHIEPFTDEMSNELRIIGKDVEFINNELAHLIADHDLTFNYDPIAMSVNMLGDVEVKSGNIDFDSQGTSTTKSKDVVFVNETSPDDKHLISFNPNFYLRIIEGVKFKGLELDASISGKLDITTQQGSMYANGRITIKEGIYKLPGQDLSINKGRLLYPPGTLLTNPMLDIKMKTTYKDDSLEIAVKGTALKPNITESGFADTNNKAYSQAALAGTKFLSDNLIDTNTLEITELGFADRDDFDIDFFQNPADSKSDVKNKDLIIGGKSAKLSNRLRAQYLRNLEKAQHKIRLKYALNENWEIGGDVGDEGAGIDLSFSIEAD